MKKYLIINPFGIGDVLFTTPVLGAIKDKYPDSFLGYWCNERVAPLLGADPRVSAVFGVSRGDLKMIAGQSKVRTFSRLLQLARDIRRERFDAAFDFSLDHRYGLLCKILGIRERIGFDYKGRGRFLTKKIPLQGYSGRHVVEYYLDLLQQIDIPASRPGMQLFLSADAQASARDLLLSAGLPQTGPLVGVAAGAGASWGRDAYIKHWPAQNFSMLADRLITERHARVVLLGDAAERPIADAIRQAMRQTPVDLVGKTGLAQAAAVIGLMDAVVTNDGGPLHMAVALRVPTVSIFGPVDERVYGPWPSSPQHAVLTAGVECRPCYRNFKLGECARQRECIFSITTDTVYQATARLLTRKG